VKRKHCVSIEVKNYQTPRMKVDIDARIIRVKGLQILLPFLDVPIWPSSGTNPDPNEVSPGDSDPERFQPDINKDDKLFSCPALLH
jgi:hypothetical protein